MRRILALAVALTAAPIGCGGDSGTLGKGA